MNKKSTGRGRPRTRPINKIDLRQNFDDGNDPDYATLLVAINRAKRAIRLRMNKIDPHNQDQCLAFEFGHLICGDEVSDGLNISHEERNADFLVHAVKNYSADDLENLFFQILKFKREFEGLRSRNYFAYAAYGNYIDEAGNEPSKASLRKYMMARPEIYRDQPGPDDKKGWTRLWEDSGLFNLNDR